MKERLTQLDGFETLFGYVFPIIGKDFLKMISGLLISVAIVLSIHYVIIPGGYEDINFAFLESSFRC